MIDNEAKEILKRAFSVLDAEQIDNFRHHLRMETPVCCQEKYLYYLDGKGGG